MKQDRIKELMSLMGSCFDGTPWHGESVMEKLDSVKFEFVNKTVNGSNSIGLLANHMVQWRLFVIEKLNGNAEFDIMLNTKEDWPDTNIRNDDDWKELIQKLQQTQTKILEILSEKHDSFLAEKTPGKKYSNLELLEGIVHHDVYHSAQIGLLNSQLNRIAVS